MYQKLEALGSSLLERFVPKVSAAAAAQACSWKYFPTCWQCDYRPCYAYCCDGAACTQVQC
ncbi:hypothetical protein KQY30_35655 [Streptomyces sp. GMY02]|uniref:hypothetical protein n=1 Tax=Streptomyces sp. GMY02 TaxID=1333528 RepID=UPI001C2C1EB9|nr:hypothetical protein [Streptomyces sp. GMY02]QXE38754.1 hypothetical protein KQY30_35655 [Streptomyces sp. GMY02]